MKIILQQEPFDPWGEVTLYQERLEKGKYGGAVAFVGTLRDFNQGREVFAMELEHYPGMTERYLERICRQAARQWEIIDALLIHRWGRVTPNDPIVLVAVWSAHRSAAFDANRFIIDALKTGAPLWKCETTDAGKLWVDGP